MQTTRFVLGFAVAASALQAMTALAAPETKTQCADVPIPAGWMRTQLRHGATCPGAADALNEVIIENLARDPVDYELDVCLPPPAVPADWVATRVIHDSTRCAVAPDPFNAQVDGYRLVRLGPASRYVQPNIDACSQTAAPTNWVVTRKQSNFNCRNQNEPAGPLNGFAHTLVFTDKYKKKGDTIWVCSDQLEPAGWAVKAAQDPGPDPCNGGGRKLIERLADAPTKPAPPTNLNAQ